MKVKNINSEIQMYMFSPILSSYLIFRHTVKLFLRLGSHQTRLTPPLSVEVPVQNQENEQSCIYVKGVSISLCDIFCFSFYCSVSTV